MKIYQVSLSFLATLALSTSVEAYSVLGSADISRPLTVYTSEQLKIIEKALEDPGQNFLIRAGHRDGSKANWIRVRSVTSRTSRLQRVGRTHAHDLGPFVQSERERIKADTERAGDFFKEQLPGHIPGAIAEHFIAKHRDLYKEHQRLKREIEELKAIQVPTEEAQKELEDNLVYYKGLKRYINNSYALSPLNLLANMWVTAQFEDGSHTYRLGDLLLRERVSAGPTQMAIGLVRPDLYKNAAEEVAKRLAELKMKLKIAQDSEHPRVQAHAEDFQKQIEVETRKEVALQNHIQDSEKKRKKGE